MLQGRKSFQFSSRTAFQYSILHQLLKEDDFENFKTYICSYEEFVKERILGLIEKKFSNYQKLSELEEDLLEHIVKEIKTAINKAQADSNKSGSIKEFIQNICRELGTKLVIPSDALQTVMFLNNENRKQFAQRLTRLVEYMKQSLTEKFRKEDLKIKLRKLNVKPQDELFKRVFGCGKQCPFCAAPCEAGRDKHDRHWVSTHRPQGVGSYRNTSSKKLVNDICSNSVHSETHVFRCHETNNKFHLYNKYKKIFPDWDIPSDLSMEESDYWKYVLTRFNGEFAEAYGALPAEIPPGWKALTEEEAEKSLKESYCIK